MEGLFLPFAAVIVIGLLSALVKKRLPSLKGKYGEERVRRELHLKLPQYRYTVLHDVTLPTNAGTTQIDHLVLSTHGVFVIETKNMSGWIFGAERQATWTQAFRSRKVSFQNPLRQNFHHMKALQELLELEERVLVPVVVFVGDAEFKTHMPDNVLKLRQLAPFILGKMDEVITPSELQRLIELIKTHRLVPGSATDEAHVQGLKRRHGQASGWLDNVSGAFHDARSVLRLVKWGIAVSTLAVLLVLGTFIPRDPKRT